MQAVAYPQSKTFEAAHHLGPDAGHGAGPETGHAIRAVIDEALAAKEEGAERVDPVQLLGHGLLDLSAYDAYLRGQLVD